MSILLDNSKRFVYSVSMMNDGNKAQRATDRNRDNELKANGSGCLFGGSAASRINQGAETMINQLRCPGCSGTLKQVDSKTSGFVYTCRKCAGLIATHVYLSDSYSLVSPYMVAVEPPAEQIRYFDISGVSSKGEYRRHGWFDPGTKKVVQAG